MFSNGFPKEWSTLRKLAWLYRTVINAVSAVLKTVTGNPIHILDALAKPAQALSVKLEPIQDLHGYDNPWPAGGGKNLLPPFASPSSTVEGVTLTNNNGEYTLNGTTDGSSIAIFDIKVSLPAGQYTVALNNPTTNAKVQIYGIDENVSVPLQVICTTANATATATFEATVKTFRIRVLANGTVDNFKLSPVFSAGATAATKFYPYSNLCPISGHTDADVIVSPTLNPADGTTYPIPLGTTVYGGQLNVLAGKVYARPYYPSYNGETLVGPWVSSMDKYEEGATPTTGAQVVDMGGTVTEISLTPTEVTLLLGENNLFSDGEMTLVYLADGNASEIEALNILLGGRYVNNHGEDEPTDREALNIILGGNER